MATRISNAIRTGMADFAVDALDGGPAAGYIEVRTGSQPASVGTAASGTLLATMTLSDPAFGAAVNGVATAAAIGSDVSVDASGTPGWFRSYTSAGTACIDGNVTITGGGGDMTFDSVTWVAGGTSTLTGWTVTQPAG